MVPLLVGRCQPYAEYTAVLLGCMPLSFASAIVRYRLMDIEVIIKKGSSLRRSCAARGDLRRHARLVGLVLGTDKDRSSFWALLATLVVALVAPSLWKAIQAGSIGSTTEIATTTAGRSSTSRASSTAISISTVSAPTRRAVRETLGVDRIAVFIREAGGEPDRFAVA